MHDDDVIHHLAVAVVISSEGASETDWRPVGCCTRKTFCWATARRQTFQLLLLLLQKKLLNKVEIKVLKNELCWALICWFYWCRVLTPPSCHSDGVSAKPGMLLFISLGWSVKCFCDWNVWPCIVCLWIRTLFVWQHCVFAWCMCVFVSDVQGSCSTIGRLIVF